MELDLSFDVLKGNHPLEDLSLLEYGYTNIKIHNLMAIWVKTFQTEILVDSVLRVLLEP